MNDRRGGFRDKGGQRDRRDGGFRSNDRRDNNRGGGFRGSRGPVEMHKAVCSECGQECEVPFKPSGDRPVYCKECFNKHKRF